MLVGGALRRGWKRLPLRRRGFSMARTTDPFREETVAMGCVDHAPPDGSEYDAIIVGGGHNGLTCAAYLAKQGVRTCVLERRHLVGGAAITEEINPGYKYSRGAYLFSLFRPRIIEELNLRAHGLRLYPRQPSSFTPLLEGRYLMLGNDEQMNTEEIGKFSTRDARAFVKYEEFLGRLTHCIEPYLDEPPPDLDFFAAPPHVQHLRGSSLGLGERTSRGVQQMKTMAEFGARMAGLGTEAVDFYEIMTAPASRILDRWFESEPLKATLATDAVIGAFMAPSTPGSGYVLFHHIMGEVDGAPGAWAYVEGGMGAVSKALASSARSHGADIHLNSAVARIEFSEVDSVRGVTLADGRCISAKAVVSNCSPTQTFLRMVAPDQVPQPYRRNIEHLCSASPVCKINISLDRLPNFRCTSTPEGHVGPEHHGTVHFIENMEQLETAYLDAKQGRLSASPSIEMTLPSVLDPTLAPPGHHVASLFIQYAPYDAPGGGGWTQGMRSDFAEHCFGLIEEYCPGFAESVVHADILMPSDLESVFGLVGGNISHVSMSLDQLFWARPSRGMARYRAPQAGLYLCGAGTHPGGGVMGSSGRSAAHMLLEDIGL